MAKTRPPYTPEFRRQMVELVRAGRSPEELAREFEPTVQSIKNWVGQAERDGGRGGEPQGQLCPRSGVPASIVVGLSGCFCFRHFHHGTAPNHAANIPSPKTSHVLRNVVPDEAGFVELARLGECRVNDVEPMRGRGRVPMILQGNRAVVLPLQRGVAHI